MVLSKRSLISITKEKVFNFLSQDEVEKALEYFEVIHHPPKTVIFKEGDFPDYIFLILRGEVVVEKLSQLRKKLS